jgi:transposase
MLGRRSSQGELFRPDHTLGDYVGRDSFYRLIAEKGPEWFRDEDFAGLYREDFGRPSVPPSQLCIALLLQSRDGVSDEEAIERSAYDLRWKVALGLDLKEKLCAKSTLQLFRAKLILHEAFESVFERSVDACRAAGLLRRRKLSVAIDTTPVLGRGAVKDTFNLVSDAIRRVVMEACQLKGWEQSKVVEKEGLGRHFSSSFKGAVDVDWSDRKARRAVVGQLVSDARVALVLASRALRGFSAASDGTGDLREAQRLLGDLLVQDIEEDPADGNGPEIRRGTARDRIISTTDPEMRHGHKSHSKGFDGYKASVVAETKSGVILATDVRGGNVEDGQGAKELAEKAAECTGKELKEVLGDTAYGGTETRSRLESLGAEVVVKVPPGTRKGMFGANEFRIERKHGTARCPAGKRSIRRDRIRGEDPGWRYVFSRNDCNSCALRDRCTKSNKTARVVQITAKTEKLRPLRRRQRTKGFRKRYRFRVVVEHRIARLVQLGIRQARYFGSKKVGFQVTMAAAVANLGLLESLRSIWGRISTQRVFLSALVASRPRIAGPWRQRLALSPQNLMGLQMAPSRPDL